MGDGGKERRLAKGEERKIADSKVLNGRRLDPVCARPVVVVIHVRGKDLLLPCALRELLGETDRLDDLLDLTLVNTPLESCFRKEDGAHQLLGDRGTAAPRTAERVQCGCDESERVKPRVLPERLVFNHGGCVNHASRNRFKGDRFAEIGTEVGELHGSSAVKDARVFAEHD